MTTSISTTVYGMNERVMNKFVYMYLHVCDPPLHTYTNEEDNYQNSSGPSRVQI